MSIEPHREVAHAPQDFEGPVSTLYSVAAGFKPNLILHTHGIGARTRVVFFHSNPNALEFRRLMVREWDGADYPAFVRYASERLPALDTGWREQSSPSSGDPDQRALERRWQEELDQWGDAPAFQKHWAAYRRLPHGFVCCDILSEPQKLFNWMTNELHAIVWFGSAFSRPLEPATDLKTSYENWIDGLASRCSGAILYGSDPHNNRVQGMRAAAYVEQYEARNGGGPHSIKFRGCPTGGH